MGILGRKSIAGVEIDAYEIRVIELGGTAGAPKLLQAGKKALPEGVVKDGKLLKPALLTEALSALWQELSIGTREVILGVNNKDVLVRFANFPKVPQDKIDNLIRFQAQEFLPISVSDVELDYVVIGEEKQGDAVQMKVLLVAARRNMIYDFLNAFEAAGLKMQDIDMSTLAIARLLPQEAEKGTCSVVNIGYEQTNILVLSMSQPHLARSLMTGQDIQQDEDEQQKDLYQWMKLGSLSEEDMERIINTIAGEIRTSINYFQSQMPGTAVDKIFLYGCGSRIRSMAQKLAEYTGIPVESINPYKRLDLSKAKSHIDVNEAGDFSVCVSLALRGLGVQ